MSLLQNKVLIQCLLLNVKIFKILRLLSSFTRKLRPHKDQGKREENTELLNAWNCSRVPATEIKNSDEVLLQSPRILAVIKIHRAPVN